MTYKSLGLVTESVTHPVDVLNPTLCVLNVLPLNAPRRAPPQRQILIGRTAAGEDG